MWSKRSQRNTLRDKTNDMTVPSGSASSSDRQLELPFYKTVNFGRVELEELSLPPNSLELPKLIQSYLAENKMPNDNEGDVQKWFNGLMEEVSSLWKSGNCCGHTQQRLGLT
ncbi:hypothetical protein F8M41_024578 [Gigaspora margarita]|uniref:Uncharacterized protein n=1 Tax=Gigaspora margarita TaxID=4874 RepID=A0A8H3XJY7_GIGMA|nr:hypothetical protein F8M41_024578 [Gigaspora margarita]